MIPKLSLWRSWITRSGTESCHHQKIQNRSYGRRTHSSTHPSPAWHIYMSERSHRISQLLLSHQSQSSQTFRYGSAPYLVIIVVMISGLSPLISMVGMHGLSCCAAASFKSSMAFLFPRLAYSMWNFSTAMREENTQRRGSVALKWLSHTY